ncbi:MAG: T9SS type A sorting domain-containing protein [Bacteroidetes bacterium]|nr:MAG: T9SS type A sorting domain-containing protein [Bacteroidota bacterium]
MKWSRSLSLLISFYFLPSLMHGQWTQLPNFPAEARDDGLVLQFQNEALLGTGLSAGFATLRNFTIFSDSSMQPHWTPMPYMPNGAERQYASSWTSGDFGFVFGGIQNSTFLNDLWKYDRVNQTWDTLTPLPGLGRSGACSFILDGKSYIVGGLTVDGYAINEVWSYDIQSDVWQQETSTPFGGRWRSSATQIDTSAYLIFGRDSAGLYHNEFYQFTKNTGWTALPPFPGTGKSHACLVPIQNRLYTFGGSDSLNNYSNELWYFDTENQTWTNETVLPSLGRRGGFALSLNNAFYYSAGLLENLNRTKETWKYIPTFNVDENQRLPLQLSPTLSSNTVRISPILILKKVVVSNLNGQVLVSLNQFNTSNAIDVSNLASGHYLVMCETMDGDKVTLRFIVE